MKDVTDFVAKDRSKFLVDRENLDTGEDVVKPGERVTFKHNGQWYTATVSDVTRGRDDDVYELKPEYEVNRYKTDTEYMVNRY